MRGGRFLTVFLALACLTSTLLAPTAYATEAAEITLTVNQIFTSGGASAAPSDVFTYRLTAQTANAPMPVGSDLEGYRFTIAGNRELEIGPIHFDTAGIFIYTLRCVTEDMPGYTIDRRVYTIEAYVSDDLANVSLIYINGGAKVSELIYEHSYQAEEGGPSPSPNPSPSPPVNPSPSPPGGNPPNNPNSPPGDAPGKPNPPGSGPKTGDFSNPALWITLIVSSGMLLTLIVWLRWKLCRSDKRGRRRN